MITLHAYCMHLVYHLQFNTFSVTVSRKYCQAYCFQATCQSSYCIVLFLLTALVMCLKSKYFDSFGIHSLIISSPTHYVMHRKQILNKKDFLVMVNWSCDQGYSYLELCFVPRGPINPSICSKEKVKRCFHITD